MHDGIELERRGVPTAAILTDPFVGAGRAMAAAEGLPDYAFTTLPHPTAELRGGAVRAAAVQVAPALEAILRGTTPPVR